MPGPGQGLIQITDETDAVRELALNGKPVTLANALLSQRHHVTVRHLNGDISIDQIVIR